MGKFGQLAGAAALAATVSAAEAQETNNNVVLAAMEDTSAKIEISIPHPDGAIVMDVTRVALETQMEIMDQLRGCLQEGFEFADADESGDLDDVEVHYFRDEGEWCAEDAELALREADADARITEASTKVADANIRMAVSEALRADAQAEINAITKGLMEGARAEGG